MSLPRLAVEKRAFTWFTTAIVVAAGCVAYLNLGKLEDPEFTVKNALVTTLYPGASPRAVEQEVTDVIERAIQRLPELKEIESTSTAGVSSIKLTIQSVYTGDVLPQVWDKLRKEVADAADDLPAGAGEPVVVDDFGDVYGFFFALYGDGYTMAELEGFADDLEKELAVLPGVSKVTLWGVRPQAVYLDVSPARLTQLGLSPADFTAALDEQNEVVDAGKLDLGTQRMRFEVTGDFETVEDIGELAIRGRLARGDDSERLLRVRDIADVRRGYRDPPSQVMRFNGFPAIGVGVSNAPGVNIIEVGETLDARLSEITAELPVGVEIGRISWQGDQVAASINGFMVSLGQAVAIVIGVLMFSMGLRSSVIVGLTGLVIVILFTFVVMTLIGEDLHRMSLGALIVAMGMMVDNAIVVCDGAAVRMRRGMDRVEAAVEAAAQPSGPLLGATVVAVMAFYPIAASTEGAGEYCIALFTIAGVSLLISWLLSMTVAPLMCVVMLPEPEQDRGDPYDTRFYRAFRGFLAACIRAKPLTILVLVGSLVASLAGFRFVDQLFFPSSDRAQFMVDLWLPPGSRIQDTDRAIEQVEAYVDALEGVTDVSTFVGAGPPRFYLPVDPQSADPSYAQLIVNVADAGAIDALVAGIQAWGDAEVSSGRVITRKYGLGPYETWAVDAKVSGPALADPAELRAIAEGLEAILRGSPEALYTRTNWREQTPLVRIAFDQNNARWTGVGRGDVAGALRRSHDGITLGTYREGDKLLPIVMRDRDAARSALGRDLPLVQVRSDFSELAVPLAQVSRGVEVRWEDASIARFDRRRTIAVQAVPRGLANDLLADVRPKIDAVELPPGYTVWWDGELRSSSESQASLIPGVVPAVIVMALIVMALFNEFRGSLIIACVAPFALVGTVLGLLVTGAPFGFVALLGAMSLAGMMIKNAIVLLDEINLEKKSGKADYDALMAAASSRLKPVVLAAGTTVLGVMPLLPDVFWSSMAVVIIFGLSLGAALTMVIVPVLYAALYRVKPAPATEPTPPATAEPTPAGP